MLPANEGPPIHARDRVKTGIGFIKITIRYLK
jgi:hypothetical protein